MSVVVWEAMERLGQLRHLDTLLTDLCTAVDRTVRPEAIELWLPVADGSGYRCAMRQGPAAGAGPAGADGIPADSALVRWLARHRQPLLLDDPARVDVAGGLHVRRPGGPAPVRQRGDRGDRPD